MPYYLLLAIVCLMFSCTATTRTTTTTKTETTTKTVDISKTTPNPYEDTYNDYLAETETKVYSWYQGVASTRGKEAYIVRLFYPEKKQITSLKTYDYNKRTLLHGAYTTWLDSGIKITEGNYENGTKSGEWKSYHSTTGNVSSQGNYRAGEYHGTWKNYDAKGRIRNEINWLDGKKQGAYIKYDTLGQEVAVYVYEGNELSETIKETAEFIAQKEKQPKTESMPYLIECEDIEERKKESDRLLMKHIYSNIMYPAVARENEAEGRAVVRFTITEEGKVEDVHTPSGVCESIEKECLRIVRLLPDWRPGMQDGKPVKVKMNMPIRFKLD